LDKTKFKHNVAVREMVADLAGDADPAGVEIMRLVRMVCNVYDVRVDDALRESGLSGPRWGLLLRMLAEEKRGRVRGMSPTDLSRCQNVSKNTISSLIGGLEEQGLVERELDRADKRVFRIHLTDAGRQAVLETAPQHVAYLNALASGLTAGERTQLIGLMEKLHASLLDRPVRSGVASE
jgi:DNA-binding MarR family transcriptional regulator